MKRLINRMKTLAAGVVRLKAAFDATALGSFLTRLGAIDLGTNGAALAMSFLFAFFPLMIVIISLARTLVLSREDTLERILSVLPPSAVATIEPVIRDVTASTSQTLVSLSVVLALWSGASGASRLIDLVRRAFSRDKATPSWFGARLESLVVALAFCLVLVLAFACQVVGRSLLDACREALPFTWIHPILVFMLQLIPFLGVVAFLAALYHWCGRAANGDRVSGKAAMAAALIVGTVWGLMANAFRLSLLGLGRQSSMYGALGGLIVLMTWFTLTSVVVVAGAALAGWWMTVAPHWARRTRIKRCRSKTMVN